MIPSCAERQKSVQIALAEDIGRGDLTASLIDANLEASANILSREYAILCGCDWCEEVFRQINPRVQLKWLAHDGDEIQSGEVFCHLQGSARALLTGERTALNFLQTLSGTATVSKSYALAVVGTKTKVLDTRKTIPGLRSAQKYAVQIGGCFNHRHGLDGGVLIKENHLFASDSMQNVVAKARRLVPHGMKIEVEVETLQQVQEALSAGADLLLLDNFDLPKISEAVRLCQGRVLLEVSGNITLDTIRTIADAGVDFISTGAITKHVRAIDLSMRFLAC
ncbi:quinolinate phosphoribosyltransferase (decarboxylating) [Gammaproteobacteria bacterium]